VPAFSSLWSRLFWRGESSRQKRRDVLKGANRAEAPARVEILF
jgi:hypothetical protein